MKEILREQDNVLFGHEPKASLDRMLELAGHLRHKLPPEVADAVPDLQARIDALPEGNLVVPEVEITQDAETILPPSDYRDAVELLADLKADVLEQAEGAYYLAHAVPLGQSYDAGQKADDEDDPGVDPTNNEIPPELLEGLSPGMQHSLQLLRDSGIIGMSMATVYTSTGILEIDYPAITAETFGELGPDGIIRPSGLSREAKVRRIVNRYVAASAAVGAGAGVVSLVPVAGTALSISGEMYLLLKLHA